MLDVGKPLPAPFALVHGPIAHWAELRPHACALACGDVRLSYSQLHARIKTRARQLQTAPDTILLAHHGRSVEYLIDFLATIASGRCAAVADPDWPAEVQARIEHLLRTGDGETGAANEVAPAEVLQASSMVRPDAADISPEAPFYIGFTSGSTGLPKGFQRHHRSWTESFRVAVSDFGIAATGRVLAPGRLSHSLFLFGALMGVWTGAGAELQERFSAAETLTTLAVGDTPVLVAVPSQLLMMLEWSQRRGHTPVDGVQLILISGARWMREHTPALRALFPGARVIEFYGASETSFITWMDADQDAPLHAVGRPFSNVKLFIGPDPWGDTAPPGTPGLIWVHSPMRFMSYVGSDDPTAAAHAGEWLSIRDMGYLDDSGSLHLCGRENRMVVTQGKNLFPEEIEAYLLSRHGVTHASVHGQPDALRGQSVHAVLAWDRTVTPRPSALALANGCRERLERFKSPRDWWLWHGQWPHTASGKTDHAAIARALRQANGSDSLACPHLTRWDAA